MVPTERRRGAAAAARRTGAWVALFRVRTEANADIKPATAKARLGAVKRLLKTWPGIEGLNPRAITPEAVFDWAARFKAEGTNFRPPGARASRRGNSATSVNSAIEALRGILDLAVERGQLRLNPVAWRRSYVGGRLKKRIVPKPRVLPSRAELESLLRAMENNGSIGAGGVEAADLCRFLLMSGARLGEVPLITWHRVQWGRGVIQIPGSKSLASARWVPLFPELASLLKKIQDRRRSAARFRADGRSGLDSEDAIFRMRECQKTIDSACRRTGFGRITHHEFRHLFATTCIESGVDVPTVSRWLGHGDGGVLAMKTYGHLRLDHSLLAAQKVSFGNSS
jgi:integrase